MSASVAAIERLRGGGSSTIFKSGPLFISSKGISWKSWKKRWFILTRTSLVFFKNDPNEPPQKGEVNISLGGIDLNNSGSVVMREDKKLLTVLFPDGRDGRAFTLKAETSEDLFEWKTALEQALAQAPNAALVMGQNGIFWNDNNDIVDGSFDRGSEKHPVKSLVLGRPILLALEDIDGRPSFLEKALQFLEKYGIEVEGILRQAADVEEVDRRVQQYEEGKIEFGFDEDPHLVGDCVKHVLRKLPSSPVPASCCTSLLDAIKIHWKEARICALRCAILETSPEPNQRLLQRVLKMMLTISSHAHKNRMTSSAVATCMAPLLLRPLLDGECDLEDDSDINGDNSTELIAAVNAANKAHAIIATLLEEYESIFDDGNVHGFSVSADACTDNSGSEDLTDNENGHVEDNGPCANPVTDDDHACVLSGKFRDNSCYVASEIDYYKAYDCDDSDVVSSRDSHGANESSGFPVVLLHARDPNAQLMEKHNGIQKVENLISEKKGSRVLPVADSYQIMGPENTQPASGFKSFIGKPVDKVTGSNFDAKRSAFWKRSKAQTPSIGSIEYSGEEEINLKRLEITKNDLQQRIAKEAKGNAVLQASLERRKDALHERRFALEQDVARLQEQLHAERDLKAALEIGLSMSCGKVFSSRSMDYKTRAELKDISLAEANVARLKEKVAELHQQLSQQQSSHYLHNLDFHQNFLHKDIDSSLPSYEEKKQITEKKGFSDLKSSLNISMDERCVVNSVSAPSTSRPVEMKYHHTGDSSPASAALIELTTRLDFFKERRSQLIEQLHSLDPNYRVTSTQDLIHRPLSPPWN